MKYRIYFKTGKRILQSIRRYSQYSDDPGKSFQKKGLSDENRYFLRKQQEELMRIRKEMQLLAKFQSKLDLKLEQSQKAIQDLMKKENQDKK